MTRIVRYSIPFSARFVEPILSGRKTVTRRFRPRHVGTHLRVKVPNGNRRPSQWPGYANIVVTRCESVLLQAIDEADALQGGVGSVEEFREVWNGLYRDRPEMRWDDNPPVWRIEFRLEPRSTVYYDISEVPDA